MDLKFALRAFRRNPGFTVLAILVMALGIGANTAVFSVVNSVLLKPLDYREPDRIVSLSSWSRTGGGHGQVSAPDFHDWHDQSNCFSAMAYYDFDPELAVSTRSGGEYGAVAEVTPEFLRVFDVSPVVGRFFTPEETRPGSSPAVVISYAYWQSHFGADPGVLGQVIRMEEHAFSIVGVLPPRFQFPDKTDIWLPANTVNAETTSRSAHNYKVVARLAPGVSLEQAQSQMSSIAARLEQQYPDSNRNKGALVSRVRDEMVGDVRTTLYVLLGAVSLVLLIACANMANLLLAKATARSREIAIRAAVGASRRRIVRQLITESLVLAGVSGVAGLLLAIWGSNVLVSLAPHNIPRLAETGFDGWVLAFTLAAAAASSLLFGLAPAVQASRVDLSDALKSGGGRTSAVGAAGRLRSGLVVAEVALSVVLLTGAGLLIKSFVALNNVALGFRPENVLVMGSSVPSSGVEGGLRAVRFYQNLLGDLAAVPGVSAVGATRMPPGQVASWGGYAIDNLPSHRDGNAPQAVFSVVSPGYFATVGVPLRRGRDFNDGDQYEAPFTAVINEALARQSFRGQDPIGRLIFCGMDSLKGMKIVGVVGDVRQRGPAGQAQPEIYMPYGQHPKVSTGMNVVVRTANVPAAVFELMRRKASERSPDVPVKFTTLETLLAENVSAPRFRTLLLGVFAALAVCLAMAGVYGVMSYVVGQRTNEIGLRMALGASPGSVVRMVMRQGLTLVAVGLLVGLAGSVAATRLLTSMLFEVKPGDPVTYAGVTALLVIVALAASYIPARRATRVDPLAALRQE